MRNQILKKTLGNLSSNEREKVTFDFQRAKELIKINQIRKMNQTFHNFHHNRDSNSKDYSINSYINKNENELSSGNRMNSVFNNNINNSNLDISLSIDGMDFHKQESNQEPYRPSTACSIENGHNHNPLSNRHRNKPSDGKPFEGKCRCSESQVIIASLLKENSLLKSEVKSLEIKLESADRKAVLFRREVNSLTERLSVKKFKDADLRLKEEDCRGLANRIKEMKREIQALSDLNKTLNSQVEAFGGIFRDFAKRKDGCFDADLLGFSYESFCYAVQGRRGFDSFAFSLLKVRTEEFSMLKYLNGFRSKEMCEKLSN